MLSVGTNPSTMSAGAALVATTKSPQKSLSTILREGKLSQSNAKLLVKLITFDLSQSDEALVTSFRQLVSDSQKPEEDDLEPTLGIEDSFQQIQWPEVASDLRGLIDQIQNAKLYDISIQKSGQKDISYFVAGNTSQLSKNKNIIGEQVHA